jgi:serine/threonine protein phosphatase PrpC
VEASEEKTAPERPTSELVIDVAPIEVKEENEAIEPAAQDEKVDEIDVPPVALTMDNVGTAPVVMEQKLSQSEGVSSEPLADVGAPLDVDTLLNERYRVLRILKQTPESIFYEAADTWACWSCQTPQEDRAEKFCVTCGAEIDRRPTVQVKETAAPTEAATLSEGAREFQIGDRLYRVDVQFDLSPALEASGFKLFAGYCSDAGKVRDIDEDSILVLQLAAICEAKGAPLLNFFAVADGIGGHAAGEVASRVGVRTLAKNILEQVFAPLMSDEPLSPETLEAKLRESIMEANKTILTVRTEKNLDMGATLTAVLTWGAQALVANVGDSRTYLMRNGKLGKVTQDHSLVGSLLAAGAIQTDEIYTHEKRNVIYRSLGDKLELDIDVFSLTLQVGDRLLLCCDGLWEMVRDPLIEDILLLEFDPQAASEKLVSLANEAGGDDNISVIVVNAQPLFNKPQSD